MPEFDTDDERNYLETTIKIRDGLETKVDFNQKSERSSKIKGYDKVRKIIDELQDQGALLEKKQN